MNKYILFFMGMFLLGQNYALGNKIDLCEKFIVDDEMSAEAKKLGGRSVTVVIEESVKKTPNYEECTELDFSHNVLQYRGATKVLEFAQLLPKLKVLDLSLNRIEELDRDSDEDLPFEKALLGLLKQDNIERVDLRGNSISHITWVRLFSLRISDPSLLGKLKWN